VRQTLTFTIILINPSLTLAVADLTWEKYLMEG